MNITEGSGDTCTAPEVYNYGPCCRQFIVVNKLINICVFIDKLLLPVELMWQTLVTQFCILVFHLH